MWGEIGSDVMTKVLDQLEVKYDGCCNNDAIDILMATNMISVGVDISRLGVEAVMGQTLSTSEYIQATSRVGRQYPGLAVVMFNASKSRDRSHYESFKARHSTLYQHVETSSLTPFSKPARHRALHAVIVGLSRFLAENLRAQNDAGAIGSAASEMDYVKSIIRDRVIKINDTELEDTLDDFDQIISRWLRLSSDVNNLVYSLFSPPRRANDRWPLLINSGERSKFLRLRAEGNALTDEYPFETMTSLRNVDTQSSLYIYT